jgi:hypothetical protein
MSTRRPLVVASLLLLAATAGAGLETDAEARRLFEEGVAAAAAGDFALAFIDFERSYELFPHPGTLKNLALAQDLAGRSADAYRSWTELLDRFGDAVSEATRAEARRRIADLEGALASIEVTVNVAEASILVDGREVGWSPLPGPLRLEPGSRVVEARRAGHEDARAVVLVRQGANPPIELLLREHELPPSVLRVESDTAGATIVIDGGVPEPAPVEREVAPGILAVVVEAPGHVAERRSVSVAPSARVVLPIHLVPYVQPPPVPDPSADEDGFWSGPWPWVIGGIVLAGAGAATAAALMWPESSATDADWLLRGR